MTQRDIMNSLLEQTNTKDKNSCPYCHGQGFIPTEDNKVKNCECLKKKLLINLYERAGIFQAYFPLTIEGDWNLNCDANGKELLNKNNKKNVKLFMNLYIKYLPKLCKGNKITPVGNVDKKSFNSLVLVGESYSGKTMLASIVAKESINQGLNAKFILWHSLSAILSNFANEEVMTELEDDFKNKDMIIIDGVEMFRNPSPMWMFNLDRICCIRLNTQKPIVITCTKEIYQTLLDKDFKTSHFWKQLISQCYPVFLN